VTQPFAPQRAGVQASGGLQSSAASQARQAVPCALHTLGNGQAVGAASAPLAQRRRRPLLHWSAAHWTQLLFTHTSPPEQSPLVAHSTQVPLMHTGSSGVLQRGRTPQPLRSSQVVTKQAPD
jgi:hypothetical protein